MTEALKYSLLPRSRTQREHDLAQVQLERFFLTANLNVHDGYQCPAPLLDSLKDNFSVDYWRNDWPVDTKRAMIATSKAIHRQKGTELSIKTALAVLGVDIDVTPWFKATPEGAPGTFSVCLSTQNQAISGELLSDAIQIVNLTKKHSAHYDLCTQVTVTGASALPLAVIGGFSETTVYMDELT